MRAYGKAEHPLLPWKCDLAPAPSRWSCFLFLSAVLALPLPADAESDSALYSVDRAGIGSCYDADLSLMLPGRVFALLSPGTVEVFFPHPPQGIAERERVVLLGDRIDAFPEGASRYMLRNVVGKDVLLAFDSTLRSPSGSLFAYIYLPEDGTCVNFKLVHDGLAAVAEQDFQFRREFEMYEQQAREKHWGVWKP